MSEQLSSFEQQREALAEKLKLREQYETQIKTLNETGVLEILPESQELGIIGIDGKGYPIPTYEQVLQRITPEKIELLDKKFEQGFTQLLLVPFGMPLGTLMDRYKRELLKHDDEGTLLSTDGSNLDLDRQDPIYCENYQNADITGELVYEPKEFSPNHQGKTKKELIAEKGAWYVSLIEDLPDLPDKGQGKTIAGRKQFEARDSIIEYVRKMQTDSQYQGEQGFPPEVELILWLTALHAKNIQLDDWCGQGKLSLLTGSYFKSSGCVPDASWFRNYNRATFDLSRPSHYLNINEGSARSRVEI